MKMSIQEVFHLMCEFKTYPELDMMVTLKYGVDFLHIFKKAAKVFGFCINEYELTLDVDYLIKLLNHMCSSYLYRNNYSVLATVLEFKI